MPGSLVDTSDLPDLVPDEDMPDHSNIVANAARQDAFKLPDLPKKNPASSMNVRYPSIMTPYEWDDKAKGAAGKGVDVATGGPYGLRNLVALGTTDEEKVNAVRKYFGDRGVHAPQGTEIGRIGPESGAPEFYDSGSGRYSTVASMSPVPFQEAPTGPGMATGGLTAAGAALGTGAFSTAAGAFGGRYLAEQGKSLIAQSLGIKNYEPGVEGVENRLMAGVKPAAIDAAFSLGGSAVLGAGQIGQYLRYGPKLFGAQALKQEFWPSIQTRMQDAAKTLNDFHTLAGDGKLNLDVGQMTDHPAVNLGIAESLKLERNKVAYELRGQDNTTELQRVFDKVTNGVRGENPPLSSGPAIQQWALDNKSALASQQQMLKDAAQESALRATDGMPQMTKDDINQRLTGQLQIVHDSDKSVVDKAWGDVAVKLGKPAEVAYSKDSNWLLDPQLKAHDFQLSPTGQVKLKTLVNEASKAGRTDPDFMGAKLNSIPGGFIQEADDGSIQIATDKTHDLYDVLNTIKSLRAGVRSDMKSARGQIPPDEQDMAKVSEILRNDVTWNLQKQGAEGASTLDAIENAENETRKYAQRWRGTVLGEVAKRADGFNYPVVSQAVDAALLQSSKDGGRAAGELADIAQGDPSFQDSIRHSILAIYKAHYTAQGVPTKALHQQFLSDMGPALSRFFTPTDMAQITHVGNLGDVVVQRSNNAIAALQAWKKSPFGALGSMNTTTISKAAFNNAKGVVGIGNFLRQNNPELLKQLQSDTAQQIALKVLNTPGQGFNQSALSSVLDPVRGRGVAEIMPKEYLDSLKTIQTTAKLMTGGQNMTLPEENTLIHRAVRLMTGAFGKEARLYHLVRGFRERQAYRMMYNTLSDPDKMRTFMSLKDAAPKAAAKMGFLATVGAEGFDAD